MYEEEIKAFVINYLYEEYPDGISLEDLTNEVIEEFIEVEEVEIVVDEIMIELLRSGEVVKEGDLFIFQN